MSRLDKEFIYASRNGHLEVVKVLLSAGANIHARDDEAIIYAKNEEIKKELLKYSKK